MRYFVGNKEIEGFKRISIKESIRLFDNQKEVAVDTETSGFFPQTKELLSLQLGDSDKQVVIDAQVIDIREYKDLLETKTILMHHAKFDLRWLYKYDIYPFGNVFDTFLAERVLTTGIDNYRRSLEACVYRYLKVTLSKDIRGLIHKLGLTKEVAEYAADDVKYLIDVARHQRKKLKEKDLMSCIELDNLFVSVLAYIEDSGMYLDQDAWKEKMDEDQYELQQALDALDEYAITHNIAIDEQASLFPICTIDWASPHQVTKLFKKLGVNIYVEDKKTKEIKESVEAPVIRNQAEKFPIIVPYLRYKSAQKEVSNYGETFLKIAKYFPDGRVRSVFTQIKNTGRLSSGGRTGSIATVNFQNIPREGKARGCFVPEDGNIFVVCDYSQQEQIILANKSEDTELLEFFQEGSGDMHSFVASRMYKELMEVPIEDIKAEFPEKRQLAKSAGFAINYGGTGYTIANNLSIPVEDGERIYNDYMDAFPGLKQYFNIQEKTVLRSGYILINNITKRKSYLPNHRRFLDEWYSIDWNLYRREKKYDTDYFRNEFKPKVSSLARMKASMRKKALNYPIQGTGADMMKVAGVKLFDWIKKNQLINKVLIPNIVHDEYVLECPVELREQVEQKLQECMVEASKMFCTILPVKAEPVSSNKWQH